jgi:hypothetical protein
MGLDMYLYNGNDQVGYWRKANQIHRWFVDNAQDGIDDCGTYDVSREQVEKLLGLVEGVLDGKLEAQDALPFMTGFFFGSTEYGEWYMEDLKDAKKILTEILDNEDLKQDWKLQYHASW